MTRPQRLCDSCLIVDDHPRHVHGIAGAQRPDQADQQVTYNDDRRAQAIAAVDKAGNRPEQPNALIRDLGDRSTQSKHLDCCLLDGCPDGSCQRRAADPTDPFDGGKTTGPALVKKLEAYAASMSQEA